ncbi:hypothetical protein EOL70_26275 [Leucothrix sargassi]|nr:hypothetical protein EOL70_26275 [Leucothrix sargassi]
MMSDYVPPTPEELRALLQALGLSRSEAGKLADVTGNKIGKWCSGGAIPYSVLFTIIAKHNGILLSAGSWRNELK